VRFGQSGTVGVRPWMCFCAIRQPFFRSWVFSTSIHSGIHSSIRINPNKPDAYNNLGITLVQLGRIDEAILQYKKALEINPDKINTLNNLAGAYVKKKRLNEAISLLQKALSIAKAEGDVSLARGITTNIEYLYREIGKAHNNNEIQN
jgi:tetratricopeptide (TPR) repeat protein